MPFVQRVVSPTFLSRSSDYGRVGGVHRSAAAAVAATSVESDSMSVSSAGIRGAKSEDPHCSKESDVIEYRGKRPAASGVEKSGQPVARSEEKIVWKSVLLNGHELDSVINITLSNTLRQLASLVIIANDIFLELNEELKQVGDRSKGIKSRISALECNLDGFDPKQVTVPESDLVTFAQIKNHFVSQQPLDKQLFTINSRTKNIKALYDAAAKSPLYYWEYNKNAEEDTCDSIFKEKTKKLKIDAEIEIRLPAALEDLRRWTSIEALGDITVTPDCVNRVGISSCNKTMPSTSIDENFSVLSSDNTLNSTRVSDDLPLDHRLPSPEEQCILIAQKFPAEVVSVDISGRRFERLCMARKTMAGCGLKAKETEAPNGEESTVKRRSRCRKPRGHRRNTIAGIDQKEIEEVVSGKNLVKSSNDLSDIESNVTRSKSNDLTDKGLSPFTLDVGKTSANKINSLKIWGRNRLKFMNWPFEKQKNVESSEAALHKTKKKYQEQERKASYSSSEKSSVSNLQGASRQVDCPASINPVKLREPSSLRKQRRSIVGHKDEPHSSSGNWSASSESGRASVGSEITIQPKSSASSTSLNQSNLHGSSAPPSSIISRRRFLNTSASSSVTSEGTATPDLQIHDASCYDDETSSAYSCDTEGYYTSFHVDSGLKTLKEEDTLTPIQSTFTLCNNNSFDSPSNQTMLTAENEYELFGRGSTSTTTSSAGTVCTALMAGESDRSLLKAPDTPERKSSLMKLTRSNSTTSNSTLERSYSSSTVGSTLERTGTIKRNGVLLRKEVSAVVHVTKDKQGVDEGNQQVLPVDSEETSIQRQTGSNLQRENSCPPSNSECSECSDLEGFDRVERIKQKTTINSSRIPSMCIITPTTSDDENTNNVVIRASFRGDGNIQQNYANCNNHVEKSNMDRKQMKKPTMYPLNSMLEKLRGVLPNIKKHPDKENTPVELSDEVIYDTAGEYVTIADFTNNNNALKAGTGVYYSNDIVRRNLAAVLSGNLNQETEYVSLNELPCNLRKEDKSSVQSNFEESPEGEKINNGNEMTEVPGTSGNTTEKRERYKGARVTFDAHGKVIYNSDSLKRRKASHSTFIPGPCVKEPECSSTAPEQLNYHTFSDSVDNDSEDIVYQSDSPLDKSKDRTVARFGYYSNKSKFEGSDTTMREDEVNSPLKQHNGPGFQHLSYSKLHFQEGSPHILSKTNQIFWTLQTKRGCRSLDNSTKDDLSALFENDCTKFNSLTKKMSGSGTPMSPLSDCSRESCNLSPISARSSSTERFRTSTPIRQRTQSSREVNFARDLFGVQNETPRYSSASDIQSSKTCSDRLGASKTSLMDFKKLLLSKSTKSSPTSKVSAVEMLKLNRNEANQPKRTANNNSINILELSASPKTFASRRMLKQGIYGSPSKSIIIKQRSGGAAWRMNAARTDVISTSIPEANSEEDNSSSGGSVGNADDKVPEKQDSGGGENVSIKDNMFLQLDRNNFMRGEIQLNTSIKSRLHRSNVEEKRAQFFANDGENKTEVHITEKVLKEDNPLSNKYTAAITGNTEIDIKNTPALETAL